MSHPPLIVSVRHTGARALRECLGLNTHKHPDHYDLKPQLERHRHIIVPLRDPLSVACSWKRRPRGKPPQFVVDEFRMLDEILPTRASVHFVCMDRPEIRQSQIDEISSEFGLAVSDLGPPPERGVFWDLTDDVREVYRIPWVAKFYDL